MPPFTTNNNNNNNNQYHHQFFLNNQQYENYPVNLLNVHEFRLKFISLNQRFFTISHNTILRSTSLLNPLSALYITLVYCLTNVFDHLVNNEHQQQRSFISPIHIHSSFQSSRLNIIYIHGSYLPRVFLDKVLSFEKNGNYTEEDIHNLSLNEWFCFYTTKSSNRNLNMNNNEYINIQYKHSCNVPPNRFN